MSWGPVQPWRICHHRADGLGEDGSVIAARDDGMRTSVHVAPPTRTRSVLENPAMGARHRATARLGIETFDALTSQALGAAILVHDLRNPKVPANPAVPLRHPHELFMFAANPGGRWRMPLDLPAALPPMLWLDKIERRRSHPPE